MKTVSIIIPIYNVERYLRQCLDSIANQSYTNIEVILVDDGSTDGSGAICDAYAAADMRFRVIHQQNAGAANAKNTGLDVVTGAYVAFVDSDDWVERNWIASMVRAVESEMADVVECNFRKEYRTRSETENDNSYCAGMFTACDYLRFYLNNWTCSLFWNKLFKANIIGDIRFRRERRCIDDEFFTYKVLTNARKIVRIEDELYHYRQRASSAVSSSKNRLQITDDALEIQRERYEWIASRFPALRKRYMKHDVEILFYFARAFDFSEKTRRKFRRNAWYYLGQSVCFMAGIHTIYYALRLCLVECWKLLDQAEQVQNENLADYYQ